MGPPIFYHHGAGQGKDTGRQTGLSGPCHEGLSYGTSLVDNKPRTRMRFKGHERVPPMVLYCRCP